jgi:hypothetical protein
MRFDLGDLLGLAFLLFFVILPAIQSFTRKQPPVDLPDEVEYQLPDKSKGETNLPRPPSTAQPPAQRPVTQQTQTQPQPQPRPTLQRPQPRPPAPKPAPARPMVSEPAKAKPVQRGKTLEQLESERLKRQPPQPSIASTPVMADISEASMAHPSSKPLSTDADAILKGIIWHQVLSEPRGRHWRKARGK